MQTSQQNRFKRRNLKIPAEISQLEAANNRMERQRQQQKPQKNGRENGDTTINGGEEGQAAAATSVAIDLSELRTRKLDKLIELALEGGVESAERMRKHELLFAAVKILMRDHPNAPVLASGTLEVMSEGYGFLRYADQSYVAAHGDIYVSPLLVRRFYLRTGDTVAGSIRMPQDSERYFSLRSMDTLNGEAANDKQRRRKFFDNLTPLFPTEILRLEREMRAEENITSRVIDMIAPIGRGQRGLLVASPKSGKTVILQQIAHAIEDNHPDVTLMVLLIDERPEEVTEMKRSVRGEVVSSTFDEAAARHVQVAELVIEKAKRLVETGKDVVILLDSITRLARAYNTMQPASGRVLSGGVDAQALQRPKRFFGAARNMEEGGSLTIIATALIETGSKMDDVIYEEFKGTGNMELHLDRRIAERRTYPAILIGKSGTRREELLLEESALKNIWVMRKALSTMDEEKAIEFLLDKLRQTKTNQDFFNLMKRGG